jgi:hypothetical protein
MDDTVPPIARQVVSLMCYLHKLCKTDAEKEFSERFKEKKVNTLIICHIWKLFTEYYGHIYIMSSSFGCSVLKSWLGD